MTPASTFVYILGMFLSCLPAMIFVSSRHSAESRKRILAAWVAAYMVAIIAAIAFWDSLDDKALAIRTVAWVTASILGITFYDSWLLARSQSGSGEKAASAT